MKPKKALIMEAMDLMAGFDIDTEANQRETLDMVINHFSNYPKPRKKGDAEEPHPNILGAYLCVSNVRNACKLGLINICRLEDVKARIDNNLMLALDLLLSVK